MDEMNNNAVAEVNEVSIENSELKASNRAGVAYAAGVATPIVAYGLFKGVCWVVRKIKAARARKAGKDTYKAEDLEIEDLD